MNMYWLYELPNWLFGVLTIAVTAAVGLSGLHTTRRWVRRVHGGRHLHNEVVGYYLSAVCVLRDHVRLTGGRARPSIYWLLRREKSRSSWQLFCSVCVTVRILEDDDDHENEDDDFSTSEFRLN